MEIHELEQIRLRHIRKVDDVDSMESDRGALLDEIDRLHQVREDLEEFGIRIGKMLQDKIVERNALADKYVELGQEANDLRNERDYWQDKAQQYQHIFEMEN